MFFLQLDAAIPNGTPTLHQEIGTASILDVTSKCAPIASALIALVVAVFVSYQIVLVRRSHQTNTFLKILEMARDKNFMDASNWVKYEMNGSFLTYEVAKNDKEAWDKISRIIHYFESLGLLVDRSFINRDLIYDQMGTWISGTWEKLESIITGHRTTKKYPDYAENFELLAKGFKEWAKKNQAKIEKRDRLGAHSSVNYYK